MIQIQRLGNALQRALLQTAGDGVSGASRLMIEPVRLLRRRAIHP